MSSKIYKITNLINNKIYIGYTKKSLEERFNLHCKGNNKMLIVKAIKKYGKENFKIELLEESENDKYIHKEREAYWINKLNAKDPKIGYNIAFGGDGGDTTSKHPKNKEIRMKRSKSEKGNLIYYNPITFESKRIMKGQSIPEGWIHGMPPKWRLKAANRNGISPANKGSVWTEDKKQEISKKTQEAMNNLPRKSCPFCNNKFIFCNFNKHVAKCKQNPNPHEPKYYIMKITNTFTGRILIDKHTDYSENIDESLGTDIYMKEALKNFDRSVFKKEIVEYCTKENKEERKQYWISFYHSDDPQIGFNKKKVL
jgi:group I intron endonuclease